LDNPSKILNYIYINAKTIPDYFNKAEELFNKEENKRSSDENSEKSTSVKKSKAAMNEKNENEKKKMEENEEKTKNDKKETVLSPKAIYNNLIDLISEKRNARAGGKKRTVNFRNVAISNMLNHADKDKKNSSNDLKKSKRFANRNWYRSVSLNKGYLYKKDNENENKRNINKSTTSYLGLGKDSKYKYGSKNSIQNANTTKNVIIASKDSKFIKKFSKRNTNIYNKRNMNRYSKRNLGNEKISSNINNDNDNIEEIFNENDNSFTTLKINNIHQRRRY
jgi:hypothetical protein